MKVDFKQISKDQLRQYVITHQEDKEAFYIYIDRLKYNPSNKVYSNSLSSQEIDQVISDYVIKDKMYKEQKHEN